MQACFRPSFLSLLAKFISRSIRKKFINSSQAAAYRVGVSRHSFDRIIKNFPHDPHPPKMENPNGKKQVPPRSSKSNRRNRKPNKSEKETSANIGMITRTSSQQRPIP
ncbi:hypothetical protein CPSG_08801 [Coccidioides posadasii str. Silveira]|uniref:Uncharacterized protein n=1 Tax=Coccidioides posadasii (strain RMSCC 757 / Silveira) TaxID=443226 RepID=E9DG52_COCPS|nr:hypothetical protein CPSG_08801 [Coccidioides posadasii str. Silveira]